MFFALSPFLTGLSSVAGTLASATEAVPVSPTGGRTEEFVLRLLFQLIAVLVATRVVVVGARRLGQTDVSGEILAGLLLGPSLLGAIAPDFMHRLFHPSTATVFVGISQCGLIFLMFQIGQEFHFGASLQAGKRRIVAVSMAGIVTPFLLGFLTAPWFWGHLPDPRPPVFAFQLFFATAMSITAIPILGRIFMELGLSNTPTAALTISAAAIDDVVGWLLLGVVSLVATDQFSGEWLAWRLGGIIVFLAVVFLVVRPLLKRFFAARFQRDGGLAPSTIGITLIVLMSAAVVTCSLNVFAIIGAFVVGVAVHDDRRFVEEWKARVAPLVNAFFLPTFFLYTGLRTDIGTLDDGLQVFECVLVCVIAFAGKFGGVYVAARAVRESNRSALTIATCMNTRALMELVALNIGYDLGVLPQSMFTKLVIMALLSTFIATPLIRWLMRGQEQVVPPVGGGGCPSC